MACCATISIPRYKTLLTVHQFLRNPLMESRYQIWRELRTSIYPRIGLTSENRQLIPCESHVKLWRTDFNFFKNNATFYTGFHLSGNVNKMSKQPDSVKKLGGEDENKKLDGEDESKKLDGEDESKKLDGEDENKKLDGEDENKKLDGEDGTKKLTLVQRFKYMCKNYWYVVLPVHFITSAVWFGGFYYLVVSGINVADLLETFGLPENWVDKIRNSKAGNVVLAYTLYKVATPVRYTITVGATTYSIKYLKKWGWIKPIPYNQKLRKIYQEQKGAFKDLTSSGYSKIQSKKDDLLKKREEFKQHIIEAKEGLHRSVDESRREVKSGMKHAAAEWKHIDRLMSCSHRQLPS